VGRKTSALACLGPRLISRAPNLQLSQLPLTHSHLVCPPKNGDQYLGQLDYICAVLDAFLTAATTCGMASVYDNASLAYGTDTNVRLIEFLPGDVWCDGEQYEINCRFHVVSLESKPDFTAISYMWGEAGETSDIVLGGKRFPVRANLFGLLEQLFYMEPGLLWVDAICIDQASIHERNHQVGLMGMIYSQARAVVVWLGDDDEEVTAAIRRLQPLSVDDDKDNADDDRVELSLEEIRERLRTPSKDSISRPRSPNLYTDGLDAALRFLRSKPVVSKHGRFDFQGRKLPWSKMLEDEPVYRQLLVLCNAPYWSRAWIVQEVILAKRVQLQSGSFRMDIESLDKGLQQVHQWLRAWKSVRAPDIVSSILNSAAAKLLVKRRKWQESRGCSYINPWDSGFGVLGCSDARDRVYAMAALMDPKIVISADYHKSPAEVFEEIFEQHLQRTGTFSGTIWNLQTMLRLDDEEAIVQRAKEFGSLEWAPLGSLGAKSHVPSPVNPQK
jgi:hypothetical protein